MHGRCMANSPFHIRSVSLTKNTHDRSQSIQTVFEFRAFIARLSSLETKSRYIFQSLHVETQPSWSVMLTSQFVLHRHIEFYCIPRPKYFSLLSYWRYIPVSTPKNNIRQFPVNSFSDRLYDTRLSYFCII